MKITELFLWMVSRRLDVKFPRFGKTRMYKNGV